MRIRVEALLTCALVALASGCADLPTIASGCGNGVQEDPEECDTWAAEGLSCRPAGSTGECRYQCVDTAATEQPHCPTGMTCGADGLCRRGTETYVSWGEPVSVTSTAVTLGDIDGDGRQDLVALGSANSYWEAYPDLLFLDSTGALRDSYALDIPVTRPIIADLEQSGDARRQITVGSLAGIGTIEATASSTVKPIAHAYRSYPGLTFRFVRIKGSTESVLHDDVLVFSSLEGDNRVAPANSSLQTATLPAPVTTLVEPIAADVIESRSDAPSPCEEALFSYEGDGRVYLVVPCDATGAWRTGTDVPKAALTLTGGHTIAGLLAARVDGDSHIDLLVRDELGNPHIAFGQGDGTFRANPSDPATEATAWPLELIGCADAGTVTTAFPLAAADLNDDGKTDLVLPSGVGLVQDVKADPATTRVTASVCLGNTPFSGSWSVASTADLDQDGKTDLVVGSLGQPGLDYLFGTGEDRLNRWTISTAAEVERILIGTFDADRFRDVAFSTKPEPNATEVPLFVAFGDPTGRPETPVEIGRFSKILQLASAQFALNDTIEEIGVLAPTGADARDSLILYIGSAHRHPIALASLASSTGNVTGYPLATTVGSFAVSTYPSVLSLGLDSCAEAACPHRLWILPGTAAGGLGLPLASEALPDDLVPLGASGVSAELVSGADLDHDGAEDALVLAAGSAAGTLGLWKIALPSDASSWASSSPVQLLSTGTGALARTSNPTFFDFNSDGDADLVWLDAATPEAPVLRVAFGERGAPRLDQAVTLDVDGKAVRGWASAADLHGTRLIAITDDTTYQVQYAAGAASSSTASAIAGVPGGASIAVGDIRGNGLLDLAIVTPGAIRIYAEVPERP